MIFQQLEAIKAKIQEIKSGIISNKLNTIIIVKNK